MSEWRFSDDADEEDCCHACGFSESECDCCIECDGQGTVVTTDFDDDYYMPKHSGQKVCPKCGGTGERKGI